MTLQIDYYNNYQMDRNDNEDSYEKVSQTNKSKTKKVKRIIQKNQKQKDKTNSFKITDYFKKSENQRPHQSSTKLNMMRTAQQQEMIQKLNTQFEEEIQLQNKLKRQAEQLKQKYETLVEQQALYFKKARQSISNDLKKRYNLIRKQKKIFSYQLGYSYEGYVMEQGRLQIQLQKKINQKKNNLLKCTSIFEKDWIKNELKNLQKQLDISKIQTEQCQQKFNLSLKEEHCRFAKLNWPIINKKYQILQLIGAGGYSQVYSAVNLFQCKNNKKVAIKLCSVKQMARNSDEQYLKHIIRQCQTHKQLEYPLIAKLIQVIQLDKQTLCLVIQFCQGVQLSKHLRRKKKLIQKQAKAIMLQVFQVLVYLSTRQNKVIHYDLKPQNIMINQGKIKVLDFGLSKSLENQHSRQYLTSQGMGTYYYLPPQVFESQPVISNKVDVWSAGVIFYELLFGQRPFGFGVQGEPQKVVQMQGSKTLYFPQDPNVSEQAQLFITRCLQSDQRIRLSPQHAYYHSYFDGMVRNIQEQKKRHSFQKMLHH